LQEQNEKKDKSKQSKLNKMHFICQSSETHVVCATCDCVDAAVETVNSWPAGHAVPAGSRKDQRPL